MCTFTGQYIGICVLSSFRTSKYGGRGGGMYKITFSCVSRKKVSKLILNGELKIL